MIEGISDPIAYGLGIIAFGGWIGLSVVIRLVLTGDLAPKRVIEAKDAELDALKETSREDRQQLTVLLTETVPTMNSLLSALRSSVPSREAP